MNKTAIKLLARMVLGFAAIITQGYFTNAQALDSKSSTAEKHEWTTEELFERLPQDTYKPPATTGLILVKEGKPLATIVIPEKASYHISYAVSVLNQYLQLVTGTTLPVVTAEKPWTEPVILIGKSRATEKYGVKTDDFINDSFRVQTGTNFVALVGGDLPVPEGSHPVNVASGTIFSIFDFLERECGVRWLIPGPLGIYYTKTSTLGVPVGINRYEQADILSRVFGGDPTWRTAHRDGGINIKDWGGHNWRLLVPLEKYWKTHPEYYALYKEKRSNNETYGGPSLCVSNPDVLQIAIKQMEDWMDQGYQLVQLCQPDAYGDAESSKNHSCCCAECLKIGGAQKQIEYFHKKICDALAKSRPGKYVEYSAYDKSGKPSPGFKLGKNVIIQLSTGKLKDWQDFECGGFSAYVYDFTFAQMMGRAHGPKESLAKTVRTCLRFKEEKSKKVYWCGFDNCWPLEGLNYYVAAKMQWDWDADPRAMMDEWLKLMYGPAEPPLRDFWAGLSRLKDKKLSQKAHKIYTCEMWVECFPEPELVKLAKLLEEANQLAKDNPTVLARLRTTQDQFRFLRATRNLCQAWLDYKNSDQKSIAPVRLLDQAQKKRKEVFDEIMDEKFKGDKGAYAGLLRAAPFEELDCGKDRQKYLECAYHEPFEVKFISQLPTEKMVKYYETGGRRETVSAARLSEPPNLDGRIIPGKYGQAQPVKLDDYVLGREITKELETEVQTAYDNKNLYLAFTCYEPAIDALAGLEEKRESKIWSTDCVEVIIQPDPKEGRSMHFMLNAGNFTYDGREGYADQNGVDWTTTWQHATSIDNKGKKWMAQLSLPFESLGVPPPRKGDQWKVQFARERYAGGLDYKTGQWMAWCPSFTGEFVNPKRFGTLVFE